MKIPGYQSYSRNRRDRMSGGIVSSVLLEDSHNCLKVSEGKDANEYILTRHSQFHPPINVLNVYGAQENRTPVEIIKKHWDDLVEEIVKIEAKGENLILIGDLNRHVGHLIDGNHEKVPMGGKLIKEIL